VALTIDAGPDLPSSLFLGPHRFVTVGRQSTGLLAWPPVNSAAKLCLAVVCDLTPGAPMPKMLR